MKTRVAVLLATWFGCGYSPVGPGTAGALGAVIPAYLLTHYAGWPAWIWPAAGVLVTFPGIWAAGVTAIHVGKKDPGLVVVDEVAGQWITLAGASALNWKTALAGFVLFRLFDIWKPPPVRQLERLPGGTGIMMDDVMAGVYGAAVLWAAGALFPGSLQ
ncbi:MAG: phosphatidylglycerophosphatase A [Acidobacteria bacterium]|nr:phosphatidylglycerophosphatase A [Acidobacteriota bacterium]